MKLTFLGTGTSVGIPVIGCNCKVCCSSDPRNKRRRSSVYIQTPEASVVIDTSLDFREQALTYGVPRVDAVLITHSHADHIFGLDDIRRYNTLQGMLIPVYASSETVADLRRIFNYINVREPEPGVFRPRLEFVEVHNSFEIGKIIVEPLQVIHGKAMTFGYRLEHGGKSLGYVPDCKEMPEAAVERFQGVDVMILDGLRHRPHPTHMTVDTALALLSRIGARHSYLTHICHDLDHEDTQEALPSGVFLACDGMVLTL